MGIIIVFSIYVVIYKKIEGVIAHKLFKIPINDEGYRSIQNAMAYTRNCAFLLGLSLATAVTFVQFSIDNYSDLLTILGSPDPIWLIGVELIVAMFIVPSITFLRIRRDENEARRIIYNREQAINSTIKNI